MVGTGVSGGKLACFTGGSAFAATGVAVGVLVGAKTGWLVAVEYGELFPALFMPLPTMIADSGVMVGVSVGREASMPLTGTAVRTIAGKGVGKGTGVSVGKLAGLTIVCSAGSVPLPPV